jgi:predicted nucleic acid-binding protein
MQPVPLVLDTNAVLDCFGFEAPESAPIVRMLESGRAGIAARAALRDELIRVLTYPELPFSEGQRHQVLLRYDALAVPIHGTRAGLLPACRDPDDQKFLEAARDAQARYLITRDKALLILARRGHRPLGFQILTPEQFALSCPAD